LLILNSYNSYYLYEFEYYYKKNNIITFYILFYLSYLFQPFNIGCFSMLKRLYDKEVENFIQFYINYIIKPDFFVCFYTTFFATFGKENIWTGFRDTNLILFNLETMISKFDIKLYISTSIGPFSAEADLWIFKTL